MPVFQDQQAVQQLLSGLNTMQMQAGLLPGGIPMYNPASSMMGMPVQSPADFSNSLRFQFQSTFSPVVSLPPMYTGVSPVPRNDFAQGILPGSSLTSGWGMARQQVLASQNQWLTGAQTISGIAGRTGFGLGLGTVGAAVGTALGGPLGGVAGGILLPMVGDAMFGQGVENLATMPFRGLIAQRQRAIELQAASANFLRTGPDLSATGTGLSMMGATDLERQLSRMSEGQLFRRDTGRMFNRQDMMRITQLSSQLGLLDQAQSVDQVARDVGRIGRALSTFMRIAEEPDVQSALQMMGRMRTMGMTLPEMTTAAMNARQFARMAGTTVQGVFQAGMQGAAAFRAQGMTGGAGLQVGMAAAGTAGLMAGTLAPRQLELLGGREGIAQNLTNAAAQVTNLSAILPALTRMENGRLVVDQQAILNLARNPQNIQQIVQESSRRMAGMGPRGFMQAWATQQNDVRDQLMNAFGGQGALLAPGLISRAVAQSAGISQGAAASMLFGEQTARTLEVGFTPEYFARLQQQQRAGAFEQQAEALRQRQGLFQEADEMRAARFRRGAFDFLFGAGVRQRVNQLRRFGNRLARGIQNEISEDQDIEEQRQMLGGGEAIAYAPADLLTSPEQLRGLRQRIQVAPQRESIFRRMREFREQVNALDQQQEERARTFNTIRRGMAMFPPTFLHSLAFDWATGERGFGVTREQRGTEGLEEIVTSQEDFRTRALDMFGLGDRRTAGAVRDRAADMLRGGMNLEQARLEGFSQARNRRLQRNLGLSEDAYGRIRARAATTVAQYARGISGNWLTGNNQGYSELEARRRIAEDLRGMTGGDRLSDMQLRQVLGNNEFLQDVLRTARAGGNAEVNAVLAGGEAAGGTIAEYARTRRQGITQEAVGQRRRDFFYNMGLDLNALDTGQARQILDIYSGEGNEAEARRLLLQFRALQNAGTPEAERQGYELLERAQRLVGDDRRFQELLSGIQGLSEAIGPEQMRAMGRSTMRNIARTSYDQTNRFLTGQAQNLQPDILYAGLQARWGQEGAEAFTKGGTGALRAYVEGRRGRLEGATATREEIRALRQGKLDDASIVEAITNETQTRARAAIAGGHTQTQGAEPEGARFATEAIELLSRNAQVLNTSFGKFDGIVDKLGTAASQLQSAADAFARKDQEGEQGVLRKNGQIAAQNSSLASQ